MSHHYSDPDFRFPQGDAAWTSLICMPFPNRETLGNPS